MKLPARWEKLVNNEDNRKKLEGLDNSIKRGAPFGDIEWQKVTAKKKWNMNQQ
jgi:hypothetical protein